MGGGLSDRDELFLKSAQKGGFLTEERIFMLRREKPFYADMSIGEVAVLKGFLDENQVRQINELAAEASRPSPAKPIAAAPSEPAPTPARPTPSVTPAHRPAAPSRPAPPPRKEPPSKGDRLADPQIKSFSRLEQYLGYARAKQASDLHLSTGYPPYVRRFGRIRFLDRPPLEPDETERLFFDALDVGQRKTLRERMNLECALDVDGQGRYRTTIIRQQKGWDGTFHIVNSRVPTIEELGLPRSVLRLADYRQGMILVTGPSGSGKTSTMAAMVDYINSKRHEHILTLEKPIEYVFQPKASQINQREIGTHTESYQRALRAALREDPDVILLGEMRDLETISLAITAAETGHLIFGTLNTTTAARTITRILDSYPPDQQPQIRTMIAESLRGILCQHLVPRKDRDGVALAIEILVVTPGISSLIREMKIHQVASAIQTGKRVGMVRMDDSLMELFRSGAIEIEEAYRRAEDKRTFAPLMPK